MRNYQELCVCIHPPPRRFASQENLQQFDAMFDSKHGGTVPVDVFNYHLAYKLTENLPIDIESYIDIIDIVDSMNRQTKVYRIGDIVLCFRLHGPAGFKVPSKFHQPLRACADF